MANLSFLTRLSADVLTEQRVFYGLNAGWGLELTVTLATILYGFALAGICRSLVVEPAGLLWHGVLGNTALNAALHPNRKEEETECVVFMVCAQIKLADFQLTIGPSGQLRDIDSS